MIIRRPSNAAILKFLIVIAIGLAAGPEFVMAMEMRILLELLGAALFTTAFVVGGELVLLELRTRVVDMLPAARASRPAAQWRAPVEEILRGLARDAGLAIVAGSRNGRARIGRDADPWRVAIPAPAGRPH
jgi:hypothetical protein